MCSVQRIPGTNLTRPLTPGVNNGIGSRIVLGSNRSHALSASTPAPGCNDVITREYAFLIYGTIARNLKEIHGQEGEGEVPSDTPNEQLCQIFSDPSAAAKREPEGQRQYEGGNRGTVTERPPETLIEHALEAERTDEDTHDTVRLAGSRDTGKHLCRSWYFGLR